MERRPREVTIPAAAFGHLRAALADTGDGGGGVSALHAAGFASGDDLYALFSAAGGGSPATLGRNRFWVTLSRFFEDRGWGTLEYEALHPGVSILSSSDWAEADSNSGPYATCAFTSGLLSSFLTRTAGGAVAVLETSCRARGDDRCVFAFGSEQAIQGLYAELLEGHALDQALARL